MGFSGRTRRRQRQTIAASATPGVWASTPKTGAMRLSTIEAVESLSVSDVPQRDCLRAAQMSPKWEQ